MVRWALVKVSGVEEKIVPPPYLREAVIEETHAAMCHAGKDRGREAVA